MINLILGIVVCGLGAFLLGRGIAMAGDGGGWSEIYLISGVVMVATGAFVADMSTAALLPR